MAKIKVYRYDDREFSANQEMLPIGDSFDILTDPQKAVEIAVRAARSDGATVRSTSLFTWADQAVAERLWARSKKKYLYEVEIDDADIRHKGDVNQYSEAADAAKLNRPFEDAITKYWNGDLAGQPYSEPRMEILVSKATVLRRLCPN